MRQTWQWKPNQRVTYYVARHRYYRGQHYQTLRIIAYIFAALVILGAIVSL